MEPTIKQLESGWVLVKFGPQCFAQIPKGWEGEIPDEYIFQPDGNREKINNWVRRKAVEG